MAEDPRYFTVAPWGYRILLPGLIGAILPPRMIVSGFEWAARLSLVAVSGLLFVYLRTRGATLRATLLAVAAVMATPPVAAVFANPFLVEPFSLALLILALIAIERRVSAWALALPLTMLALTKEIWIFLLPLIYLRERESATREAALRRAGSAALPAIWVSVLIRAMWAPQTVWEWPQNTVSAERLLVAFEGIARVAPQFLLGGLTVMAAFALFRPAARAYLKEHALTLTPLLVLPLLAAVYTGAGAANNFFEDDVRRLLIYVLPFAAAVAVQIDPAHDAPSTPLEAGSPNPLARGLVIALALFPLALDRYWRIDLSTTRDGPYVLGFARESLRTARRLERGQGVVFDPAERRFAWGVSSPSDLAKLRFFLRDGFGPLAHYGIHDIRIRESLATLTIPLLQARPLRLTLTMDARDSAWVTVLAGGAKAGEALIGPQAVALTVEIPKERLFRGDNVIGLQCEKAATVLPRILRVEMSQAAAR